MQKLETSQDQQGEHDARGCYQRHKDVEGLEFRREYVDGGCGSGGNMWEDCGGGGYNRLQWERGLPGRRKKIDYEPIQGWDVGRRNMRLVVDKQGIEEEDEDDFESCDSDMESTADYFDAKDSLETKEELLNKSKTEDPRLPGSAATRLLIHRSAESRSCSPVDTAQQLGGIRQGILQFTRQNGWTQSTLIQSMLWPAVARGYSVVGVAGEKAGKTAGWMLPLVNQLTDWASYRKLPLGGGPKVVVLAEGRKSVQEVKGIIVDFIWQSNIDLVVSEAYAGMEEDEKFKLINGVDILVTTPNCLIELMDQRITNLNRCCHLILEEGDRLLEWFPSQVRKVMEAWRSVDHKFVGLPHQTVLVAQQFTERIKTFAEAFMKREVLIVFDNLQEAAIYGSLKVSPHLFSYEDKLEKVVNLVATKDLRRVAICCTNNDVGIKIVEHLKLFNVDTIFLHEKLNDDEYEDVFDCWVVNDDIPLIVTDEASLKITYLVPAHLLIHWDLPQDRHKFALRFMWLKPAIKSFHESPALLAYDYYNDFKPECQILVSEKDDLDYVMEFLQRIRAVVPEELVLQYRDVTETQRNVSQEQLCEQIVSSGVCRDDVLGRCKGRHHLDLELDNPSEDRGTVVMFKVIDVKNPVQYKVKMKDTGVVRTVVVAGLAPLDGDIDWDEAITELVAEKLTNIDDAKKVVIRGRVLLAIGNILLVKQCQLLHFLPETKTFVEHFETRSYLISGGLALENSGHMEALERLVDSLEAPLCKKNNNKEESNVEGKDDIAANVQSQSDGKAGNPSKESFQETIFVKDDRPAESKKVDSLNVDADQKMGSLNKNVEDGEDLENHSEDSEDLNISSEEDQISYLDYQDEILRNLLATLCGKIDLERETLCGKIDIERETTSFDNDASILVPSSTSVPGTLQSSRHVTPPSSSPLKSSVLQMPLGMSTAGMVDQLPSSMPSPAMVTQLPSSMPSSAMVEQVSSENRNQLLIIWSQNKQRIKVEVTPAAMDEKSIPRDLTLDQVFVNVEQQQLEVQILEVIVDQEAREEFILHTTGPLETFGHLDTSETTVKVNGKVLEIQLCSKEDQRWMRLTKEKFGFIKVDLDKCEEDNDETDVEELEWGAHFDKEVSVECGAADGYFSTNHGDRFSWESGERVLPVDDLNWALNDTNRMTNVDELLLEDVIDRAEDVNIEIAEGDYTAELKQGNKRRLVESCKFGCAVWNYCSVKFLNSGGDFVTCITYDIRTVSNCEQESSVFNLRCQYNFKSDMTFFLTCKSVTI